MSVLTFEELQRRWPDCPSGLLSLGFDSLPEREQAACWEELREQAEMRIDAQQELDRQREEPWCGKCRRFGHDEPCPGRRHQPARRFTAATSSKPGAVSLSDGDPLKNTEPRLYVEALTGEPVPANGWLSCPLPDHDDRTPSFQVLSSHWRCFGCDRGGSVIDLAAALYGIEPRGKGYWRLRDLIIERLLWAPIRPGGDR